MPAANLLALAAKGIKKFADGGVPGAIAQKYLEIYSGSFEVTIGSDLSAVFGEEHHNVFGNETSLVSSGSLAGLGAFFSLFANAPSVLTPFLGLSGETKFVYGATAEVAYGGPFVSIERGTSIRKVSEKPLGFFKAPGVQENAPELVEEPEEPAGLEMAADDKASLNALTALSMLLNLSTAILELTIRFAYPEHREEAEKKHHQENKPLTPLTPATAQGDAKPLTPLTPATPAKNGEEHHEDAGIGPKFFLDIAVTKVPDILMAVIYHIETCGGWGRYGKAMKDNIADIGKKVASFAKTVGKKALAALKYLGKLLLKVLIVVAKVLLAAFATALLVGAVWASSPKK